MDQLKYYRYDQFNGNIDAGILIDFSSKIC